MDGEAWWAAVHGVAKTQTRLSDFTFTFHFHALEKEMATHSSVLAWRIPGMGEPCGLPSQGSHRVGHDWSDLAAAAVLLFSSGVLSHPTWGWASHVGVWNLCFQGLAWCDCIFSPPSCTCLLLLFSTETVNLCWLVSHPFPSFSFTFQTGVDLSIHVSILKEKDSSVHQVLNYWVCSLLYSICILSFKCITGDFPNRNRRLRRGGKNTQKNYTKKILMIQTTMVVWSFT